MPRGQTSVYHRILIYIPPRLIYRWPGIDATENTLVKNVANALSLPLLLLPLPPPCVKRAGTILCIQATMNKLRSESAKVTLLFPLERREDSYQRCRKKKTLHIAWNVLFSDIIWRNCTFNCTLAVWRRMVSRRVVSLQGVWRGMWDFCFVSE